MAGRQSTQQPTFIESVGKVVDKIIVQLSARFLEHFSQQLYSSPNKAFEELLANSWDAGARTVHVIIPEDLTAAGKAIFVLDDGTSMDADGLHDLWKVAYSNKRQRASAHGRLTIGKFGIGKLATYVLANKLTYICKAADGVIRTVTMNYGDIGLDQKAVLIKDLSLELRETGMQDLEALLSASPESRQILELIREDMPVPPRKLEWEDEFGGVKSEIPKASGCWTLVVLSDLKDQGKAVKKGIVRRMIQTSLPLGAELNIVLNGELLSSTKADRELMKEWAIGPDLD